MIEEAYVRYCAIEAKLENDEELNHLKQRLQDSSEKICALMSQLTEEQQVILTEHLGICAEIDQRIVEIACFFEK